MDIIVTKKKIIETDKVIELRGVFMDWAGLVHPVVSLKKKIGLLSSSSTSYEAVMDFLGTHYYHPYVGFWVGSGLHREIERAGGRVQKLDLGSYYSMIQLKDGCVSASVCIEDMLYDMN